MIGLGKEFVGFDSRLLLEISAVEANQ